MVCLETTFVVDILRGRQEVEDLKNEFDKIGISSVASPSVMEVWSGALMGKLPEKGKINALLSSLLVLPLDEKSAREAGEIQAELSKSGRQIGITDIMIAGVARANGEKLVTRDEHYAKVPGLRILKY